mgnify:CR=1 FL=1
MKAVFLPGDKRVDIRDIAIPKPAVDEVLVQIKASCICRSDLSLYYGNAVLGGVVPGRFICGHEPAGFVEELGQGVTTLRVGDRVAVHLALGCGTCPACRRWRSPSA